MSEENIHGLEVGSQLWRVPDAFGRPPKPGKSVTVVKIGRAWATLDNGERVDLRTLKVDGRGYSSPAKCYGSEAEYEQTVAINQRWNYIARRIAVGCRPPFIDESAIAMLSGILRIQIPEDAHDPH